MCPENTNKCEKYIIYFKQKNRTCIPALMYQRQTERLSITWSRINKTYTIYSEKKKFVSWKKKKKNSSDALG